MIDDATVFRLGQDNFRFVGGDEYDGVWLREVADRDGLRAWIKPSTDQLHNLAAAGPAEPRGPGRDRVDAADPAEPGRAQVVPLPDRADRRLRRDPDRRLAHRLHRRARLRDLVPPVRRTGGVGRDLGGRPSRAACKPLGLEALDILRIESGLIFAGYEFDDQVDPFEAGIGFTVALATTRTSSAATR